MKKFLFLVSLVWLVGCATTLDGKLLQSFDALTRTASAAINSYHEYALTVGVSNEELIKARSIVSAYYQALTVVEQTKNNYYAGKGTESDFNLAMQTFQPVAQNLLTFVAAILAKK